jgi:hypothetical protein
MLCKVLGAVFLLVGILGFIPNPIVSDDADAIFAADAMHNIVHLATGVVFVGIGFMAAEAMARTWMIVFGAVYLVVGLLGFTSILDDIILHNTADTYLHLVLGVAILGLGLGVKAPMGGTMKGPTA